MGKHLAQIGGSPEVGNTEGKTPLYFLFSNHLQMEVFFLLEDLTGRKFGYWTVIDRDTTKRKTYDVRWNCVCKCGTKRSVLGKYLRTGKSVSCGCASKKDYTGQRFGKLTVIETVWGYNNDNSATCLCKCDCGNYKYIKASYIKKEKSCGCSRLADDITGNRYGSLVVQKMLYHYKNNQQTYCLCLCDCGNIIDVKLESLKDGNTTSCGCKHSPNLLNRRFGYLTVIKELPSKNKKRRWDCLCDCGNHTVLTSSKLLSGHTKSCGCLRSESTSVGETIISKYLHDKNVLFVPQKTVDGLVGVGNKLLRYDFYLPDYNTIIEYDGIQHNNVVEYWGGEDGLKTRLEDDRRKNVYCLVHRIRLIRINHCNKDDDLLNKLDEIINDIKENPVTITDTLVTA